MAKILIVEDDLAFGTMIQTWLRKKGFEVERATSVKSALHFFEDNSHWDLVLSDLRLPDHDGLTLLQWLKKHDYTIPFIVMTSYAEVQNAVLAMKSGATDYVAKPFHPDILLEKIQEALKAGRQALPRMDSEDLHELSD
jgi:two-component system, NtrC family, response regulator HydG